MAKIRDFAVTISQATVTSLPCAMPEHATGDLLVVFASKDGTPAINLETNWTAVQAGATAGHYQRVQAKRATSGSETFTATTGTLESFTVVIVAIKGCFGTTVADAIPTSFRAAADDSTLPFDGGSITTAQANSLVLGMWSSDSGLGPMALPGWVSIFGGDDAGSSLALSYTYKRTTGSLSHPGYWAGGADDGRAILVEVRDDGNETEIDAYLDRGTVPSKLVTPLVGASAADKGTWLAANAVELLTLAGKTVTGVAIAAAADSGNIPFRGAARHIAPSSTTGLGASQLTFTTAEDLSVYENLLFGTFRPQVPRDYLDMGSAANGGTYIRLADASGNHKAWIVAAQFSVTTDPSNRQNFAIEVGSTDTVYDSSGTLTQTAVNRLFLGGSGYFGAASIEWSELYLLNRCVIAGGTSANPIGFLDVELAINGGNGKIPLMQRAGAAATLWIPVQFGGGDPCRVSVALRTFQFPRKADEVDYLDFHVSNNKVGVEFFGQAGDVLKFTGCVFTSESPYYWRFNASHSASATIDFTGTTVVGATVTLRSSVSLSRVSFTNCPSFTQNNAALANCVFSGTKVLSDNPADLSDCSFTSSGTGHAIEITAPGTYAFDGNTFTGYGAGGSTDAAVYNNSGGAVTLNVTGGGSTPTVRNGAGASTTVNANVSVTITGLKNPSEVRVFSQGTATEIAGQENVTTGSFVFAVGSGVAVDIAILSLGYQNLRILNYSTTADASLPVQQVLDRQYLNP